MILAAGWPHLYFLYRRKNWSKVSWILRSLVLLSCVAGMARPEWRGKIPVAERVYLLDVSGSAKGAVEAILPDLARQLEKTGKADRNGVAVFSGERAWWVPVGAGARLTGETLPTFSEEATDIAGAVLWVAAQGAREIVLVTDGREQGESFDALIDRLGKNDVDLRVLPAWPTGADARVDALEMPSTARPGERVEAVVRFAGSDGEYEFEFYEDDALLKKERVVLPGGETLVIPLTAGGPGLRRYKVALFARDLFPQNNQAASALLVEDAARVLVLCKSPEGSAFLLLKNAGVDVRAAASADVLELSRYEAVILDNVALDDLPRDFLNALPGYVNAGGGLAMTGVEGAFGYGGYAKSAVDGILPVFCEPAEPDPAALIVVLDRSGSMSEAAQGNLTKMDFARDAVTQGVLPWLDFARGDRLGLLVFNDAVTESIAFDRPTSPDAVARAVGGLSAFGRTELYAPLARAVEMLESAPFNHKKILVLSDGKSTVATKPESEFRALGEKCRVEKIDVVAIAPGQAEPPPELTALSAKAHRGTYETLKELFQREARSLKTLHREGVFSVRVAEGAGAPWSGLSSLPPVDRYHRVSLRPEGKWIWESELHEPILAERNVGLGRTLALTLDAGGAWRSWRDLSALLSALAARLSSGNRQTDWRLTSKIRAGRLCVEAAGEDLKNLALRLAGPETLEIALRQTGLNVYTGSHPVPKAGGYVAVLTEDGQKALKQFPLSVPYAEEWRHVGAGTEFFERVKRWPGARLLNSLEEVGPSPERTRPEWRDVGDFFYWAALAVFLAGIFFRK